MAILTENRVFFSKSFGNSWSEATTPAGFVASQLLWAHSGSISVLLAVQAASVWRADMSVALPNLEEYTAVLLSTASDLNTVGNGGNSPYAAVVNDDGSRIDIYNITASGSFTLLDSVTLSSGVGQPDYIAMGGTTTTAGAA